MESQSEKNHQFYMESSFEEYAGEWVAIYDNKVISHGNDVKKVFEEFIKKFPGKKPLITWIPGEETLITLSQI
jgi:hypothetical protein